MRLAIFIVAATTLLALVIVNAFNGWVPPTVPMKVIVPLPAARVKFLVLSASPSNVLLNEIFAPPVDNVDPAELFRTTATGNVNGPADVVILAPK